MQHRGELKKIDAPEILELVTNATLNAKAPAAEAQATYPVQRLSKKTASSNPWQHRCKELVTLAILTSWIDNFAA